MAEILKTRGEFNNIEKQMKKLQFLFLLLILNNAIAQNINLNKGETETENYLTEVNFEFVNGKIIIPVVINNITYRFLLDTGASNLISKKLTTILNPKFQNKIEVSDANENKTSMNIVELPNLTIGNINFKNTVALSSDDEKNLVFDCFNIDGFIGSNLLRNSIIQIDINKKILTITNDIKNFKLDKRNSSKLQLLGIQSSPYIWVKLIGTNSGKEQVLLDTGMKGFYSISNKHFNLFEKAKIFEVNATGNGTESISLFGNSISSNHTRLLLPKLKITNSNFLNITTLTTNDDNSKIGIDLFEKGIGTIDFKNKRFYFDEYTINTDLTEKQIGFLPTILNNKLSIGIVWDENLKNIIFTGDEIIAINNINYENYAICDLISKKSIFKDIVIEKITIKNKEGEIKELKI
ncbi:hypothetical protein IWX83_003516 [Flavobacterium sp. CG_9.1]|uniref:retropepsin-like aspartic protease n=1 Tax=Flavobacterium sp. CG_9.1 TaxID=2787728 RepID=UPI0018CA320C|nr:retropepsin-like aspartic protease [Flavobacterium sp. CG_9.1]MBG6063698.1 hypothetical protein [Flavobacterium sp. CG_9.1]